MLLESCHVNLWIGWVKHHPRVVLTFQIGKHMEDCVEMSFSRQGHVSGQNRNFSYDVDSSQFDYPVQYTDLRLVIRGQNRTKFRRIVKFSQIVRWPGSVDPLREFTSSKILSKVQLCVAYRLLHIFAWT